MPHANEAEIENSATRGTLAQLEQLRSMAKPDGIQFLGHDYAAKTDSVPTRIEIQTRSGDLDVWEKCRGPRAGNWYRPVSTIKPGGA